MTKYLAVLPYVYDPYYEACKATIKLDPANLLILNARALDLGHPQAINQAIDLLRQRGDEWLIVLNPAIRFGNPGGNDILPYLDNTDANFVFFANNEMQFAWHCCAIRRNVFDRIGKMDANFYPTYFEDVDFDLRFALGFGEERPVYNIDATNESFGHSVNLAKVKVDTNYLITYFATKWGVHPSAIPVLGSYKHPFNDNHKGLDFWPPARGETHDA